MPDKTPADPVRPDDAARLLKEAKDAYAALFAADTSRVEYLNVLAQLVNAEQQAAQAAAPRPRP